MQLGRPAVSVCMATYNGEKFIHEQLRSILSQLNSYDEVVISDDSSSDNTIHIIESIGDPRIRLIRHQRFRSPIFNFEHVLKQASHDIIFLADQDDIWREGKVDAMTSYLNDYDAVVCDHDLIDESNEIIRHSFFKYRPPSDNIVKNLWRNAYFGCCLAFRRHVLKKALPFPRDIPMHDIWLGFVITIFYKTKFLHQSYTLYRKHSNNSSPATELESEYSVFKKVGFRVNLIKYIPLLWRR